MASSNILSLEEVIREVASGGDRTKKVSVYSLEEVVRDSADHFASLRDFIPNYHGFVEEVKKELVCIYRRYEAGVTKTDKMLKSSIPALPMICAEVLLWIKGIHRRMVVNPRARNPWFITVNRDLPEEVFLCMRAAINGSSTAYGVSIQADEVKFIHKDRLLWDLSKFCGMSTKEIDAKLQKRFTGHRKGFRAEIVVGEGKPFIISYDKKKLKVTLSCHYGCWNSFGYGFHDQ